MRFAICCRSTSMGDRCCPPTNRTSRASTTWRACSRSRRDCWRTTSQRPATVSRLAVGDRSIGIVENAFKIPTALAQDDRISDDLPFGSRGGISVPYHFPLDGEYRIKVLLKRQLYLYLIGMGEPHQIDIRLDGSLIKRFTIGGEGKGRTAPESFAGNTQGEPGWEVYMHTADEGLTVSIPVTAGEHNVGVSFVRTSLGARRHPAATAARIRAHDQRAVLRQPLCGHRDHRRPVLREAGDGHAKPPKRCSSAVRQRQRLPMSAVRGRSCPGSRGAPIDVR